jgi:hypothetical protein
MRCCIHAVTVEMPIGTIGRDIWELDEKDSLDNARVLAAMLSRVPEYAYTEVYTQERNGNDEVGPVKRQALYVRGWQVI